MLPNNDRRCAYLVQALGWELSVKDGQVISLSKLYCHMSMLTCCRSRDSRARLSMGRGGEELSPEGMGKPQDLPAQHGESHLSSPPRHFHDAHYANLFSALLCLKRFKWRGKGRGRFPPTESFVHVYSSKSLEFKYIWWMNVCVASFLSCLPGLSIPEIGEVEECKPGVTNVCN